MATNPERQKFGARLRMQRESRSLSVPDVVKVTKIPEKQIVHLEAGELDELPAEVFVRGFLRSYCKCVGLEADETIRDYGELLAEGAPKKREAATLTRPAPRRESLERPVVEAAVAAAPAGVLAGATATVTPTPVPAPPAAPPEDPREAAERRIFAALASAGQGTNRTTLTIAVVVLVIVATLTLSLLMRA